MSDPLKVLGKALLAWYEREVGEEPSQQVRAVINRAAYSTLKPRRRLFEKVDLFEKDPLFSLDMEDFF